MADVTKPPEHQLRLERISPSENDNVPNMGVGELAVDDDQTRSKGPAPWPFTAESHSPLEWWRRLPPDAFRDAERLVVIATLGQITVLHGHKDLAAALKGDPASAIGAALGLMPIEEVTLQVDITMTALMHIALDGNAAAALVMAQIIGLTDLGHELAGELAAAWLAFGERHSGEPSKFGAAQVVLLKAFEEHRNKGDA
jgi:hypothetical protein